MVLVFSLSMIITNPVSAQEEKNKQNSTNIMMPANMVLSGMQSLTESHLKAVEHNLTMTRKSLNMMMDSKEDKSIDWKTVKPLLKEAEMLSVPAVYWFANPDGSYYTVDKDKTDQSLKDRDYFPKVLKGEDIFGALVVSHSTGKKSVIIAKPLKIDDKVIGVLGASVFLEDLNELIKIQMAFTDKDLFFVLDENGETVLNWKSDRILKYPEKMGDVSLADAVKNMMKMDEGIVMYSYKDKERKVQFLKSPMTGWRYALGHMEN